MKRRAAFTLLEIIVVLAILSLVASVVGFQISSCISRYAYHKEVEEVYNGIKHAKMLSLTYRTDISVHFLKDDGVVYYQLQTDEPFSDALFDRGRKALKKVDRFTFNDKSFKHFDFTIYSNGNIEPRGVLGFFPHSKKEENALWLNFPGAFELAFSEKKPTLLKERSPFFPGDQLKKFHSKKDGI
jgi:prepilin-type N-terminal cleavage/methylation domain-containing protein